MLPRSAILAISLLTAQVVAAQEINVKKDKFTEKAWLVAECGDQMSFAGQFFGGWWVPFRLVAFPGTNPRYYLKVEVGGEGWLFIEPGNSLFLKFDGKIVPLTTVSGSRDHREVGGLRPGKIHEIADFVLSTDLMLQLSKSETIEWRIVGSKGTLDGKVSDKAKRALGNLHRLVGDNNAWEIQGNKVIPLQVSAVSPPSNQVANTLIPQATVPGASGSSQSLKAGIKYATLQNVLIVAMVDPGSPNSHLVGKFIVSIEGEKGTGQELVAKLTAAIAKHQDGSPIKLKVTGAPGKSEEDAVLILF